jgi:ribonuclease HI
MTEPTNHSGFLNHSRLEDMQPTPSIIPTEETVLINVDAAFRPLTGDSAIGAVIRDQSGLIIAASSRTIDRCQDAEEAEAKAILVGLQLAIEMGINQPTLMSDCAAAVSAVRSPGTNLSKNWCVYKEIVDASTQLPGCAVRYVRRKLNSIAHSLAQFAIQSGTCELWLAPVPAFISELALSDVVNSDCE